MAPRILMRESGACVSLYVESLSHLLPFFVALYFVLVLAYILLPPSRPGRSG